MCKPQPVFTYVTEWSIIVEEARLKPGLISTHKGPARNMSELRNAAKLAYAIHPQLQCIKI